MKNIMEAVQADGITKHGWTRCLSCYCILWVFKFKMLWHTQWETSSHLSEQVSFEFGLGIWRQDCTAAEFSLHRS